MMRAYSTPTPVKLRYGRAGVRYHNHTHVQGDWTLKACQISHCGWVEAGTQTAIARIASPGNNGFLSALRGGRYVSRACHGAHHRALV
jgi:hypothetical protein